MANGSWHRCGFCRQATRAALCALLAFLVLTPALAQEQPRRRTPYPRETPSAPRFISQFGIDEAMFGALCEALNLDADQRSKAQRLHAVYVADAEKYSEELYQRVLDGGLQEYWDAYADARDAGEPTPEARMNELHQRYTRIRFEGYPHADQQVVDFYESMDKLLTPAQQARMEGAQRLMRRLNWFQRVAGERPARAKRSDFDLSLVDPFALWIETSKDWPEQKALCREPCISSFGVTDPSTLTDDDPLLDGCRRAFEAFETYELQIDTVVRDRMDEARRPPSPDRPGVAPADSPKFERRIARWAEEHRILDRCIVDLTEAVRSLKGNQAAQEFRDRYVAALCPDLIQEGWPDRMVAWLEARSDDTPEQLDAARDLYASYKTDIRHLTELAVEAGISAKRKYLTHDGKEAEQLEFDRRTDDMRDLIERTLITFRGLLRPEQIGNFDDRAFTDIFLLGNLSGPGGGGFERLRELLKPPTPIDELDRRAEGEWSRREEERRATDNQ